jgi:flagellar hook-length control protein FliK
VRSPAEQIAIQIQKGLGAGADKISIKLHPENLGRVEVKLEVTKDGHLAASISADKPHTLDLLKQDSRILERALQEAGLQTNSDSLSFSLSGNGSNQTLPEDRSAGNAQLAAGDANLANLPIDNVVAPNVAYGVNVASDGGVDITV